MRNVSKSWAACSTPSTEKRTGHLPVSQHQMHSIMRYDSPNGRFVKSIEVPRTGVFPSCRKNDTVPRRHGCQRTFENEREVETAPRRRSYPRILMTPRRAVLPSFRKRATVPKRHGHPRTFENEREVETAPRRRSYPRILTAPRKAVFLSFRRSETVPRRHSYPRTFECEH